MLTGAAADKSLTSSRFSRLQNGSSHSDLRQQVRPPSSSKECSYRLGCGVSGIMELLSPSSLWDSLRCPADAASSCGWGGGQPQLEMGADRLRAVCRKTQAVGAENFTLSDLKIYFKYVEKRNSGQINTIRPLEKNKELRKRPSYIWKCEKWGGDMDLLHLSIVCRWINVIKIKYNKWCRDN